MIGTMGTGKTQFTKSLVTQLIRNQANNVDDQPIGVLVLDDRADYVKEDFSKPAVRKCWTFIVSRSIFLATCRCLQCTWRVIS